MIRAVSYKKRTPPSGGFYVSLGRECNREKDLLKPENIVPGCACVVLVTTFFIILFCIIFAFVIWGLN